MDDQRGDTGPQEISSRRRSFVARRRKRRIRRTLTALGAIVCLCVCVYALSFAFSFGAETQSSSESASSSQTTDVREATTREKTIPVEKEKTVEVPPPQASCDGLHVQVGRNNPLPATYAPQDLGSLVAVGVPTNGGDMYLRERATIPLARMISDATAAGQELVVISAYRSYADQEATFAHYSTIYGPGEVEMVSAPPGQSQHQLGTTVDFSNAEVGYQLIPTFSQTSASAWLEDNAWKHGYVNTYPEGDEAGTGRQYEAWEYRFIGRTTAEEMHDKDISLNAFLKEQGYPPRC